MKLHATCTRCKVPFSTPRPTGWCNPCKTTWRRKRGIRPLVDWLQLVAVPPEEKRLKRNASAARRRFASPYSLLSGLYYTARPRRDRKIGSTLTLSELYDIYRNQKGKCHYSGIPMTWSGGSGYVDTNISIDRLDSARPYTKENVVLCCYVVNVSKHDKTIDEWLHWAEAVWRHRSKQPMLRIVS